MAEQMEILLETDRKPEVADVLKLLDEMTQAEKQEMLIFMQGVIFARNVKKGDSWKNCQGSKCTS